MRKDWTGKLSLEAMEPLLIDGSPPCFPSADGDADNFHQFHQVYSVKHTKPALCPRRAMERQYYLKIMNYYSAAWGWPACLLMLVLTSSILR